MANTLVFSRSVGATAGKFAKGLSTRSTTSPASGSASKGGACQPLAASNATMAWSRL